MPRPKRPKHSGRRKAAVKSGYRSAFEHDIAKDLKARGIEFNYETETCTYELKLSGGRCQECGSKRVGRVHKYTPDFVLPNGIRVEAKGRLCSRDRTKLRSIWEQKRCPGLHLLFQADNWTTNLHKQRYSSWAKQVGIPYAVGKTIPDSWVK